MSPPGRRMCTQSSANSPHPAARPPLHIPAPLSEHPSPELRDHPPVDLLDLLAANHGAMRLSELLAGGISRRTIANALMAKLIEQPKRGWYALPSDTRSDAQVARLIGGTLTCVSALRHHGLWVPRSPQGRHVRAPERTARAWLTDPLHAKYGPGTTLHRDSRRWRSPEATDSIDEPLTAVLAAAQCLLTSDLVAVLESLLQRGCTFDQIGALGEQSSAGLRDALSRVVGADSGNESLVRMRLQQARIEARPRVKLGPWTVDLLIGDWLVIEVDGYAYHSARAEFERDRLKDRDLITRGYTVMRLATRDVETAWSTSLEHIQQAVRAGWHRRPRPGAQPDFERE